MLTELTGVPLPSMAFEMPSKVMADQGTNTLTLLPRRLPVFLPSCAVSTEQTAEQDPLCLSLGLSDDARLCVQARTMVTRDLFGNYEHQLAAQAEKTIATFKATYAKDNSMRADFFALDDTALPTCASSRTCLRAVPRTRGVCTALGHSAARFHVAEVHASC